MQYRTKLVLLSVVFTILAIAFVATMRYHSLSGDIVGEVMVSTPPPDSGQARSSSDAGINASTDGGVSVDTSGDATDDAQPDAATSVPASLAKGSRRFRLVPTESESVALARIFWSEAQPDGDEDHKAIYSVIVNVRDRTCNRRRYKRITQCDSRGETMLSAARRAASRVTGGRVLWDPGFDTRRLTQRQRWISTLTNSDGPPSGWIECRPGHRPGRRRNYCAGAWSDYEGPWRSLRRKAKRFLRWRRVSHACRAPTRIMAWGGSMDNHIAYGRGLVLVQCAAVMRNKFWRFPSRDERSLLRQGLMTYNLGVLTDLRDAGVVVDTVPSTTEAPDADRPFD